MTKKQLKVYLALAVVLLFLFLFGGGDIFFFLSVFLAFYLTKKMLPQPLIPISEYKKNMQDLVDKCKNNPLSEWDDSIRYYINFMCISASLYMRCLVIFILVLIPAQVVLDLLKPSMSQEAFTHWDKNLPILIAALIFIYIQFAYVKAFRIILKVEHG